MENPTLGAGWGPKPVVLIQKIVYVLLLHMASNGKRARISCSQRFPSLNGPYTNSPIGTGHW